MGSKKNVRKSIWCPHRRGVHKARFHCTLFLTIITHRCAECDATFKHNGALSNHRRRHHPVEGDNQYKCSVCGDTFKYIGKFVNHRRIKHGLETAAENT